MRTCLVLGAGASLANALHFRAKRRRDTWPPLDTTFFETVDARGIALSAALRRYFQIVLGKDPTAMSLRELRMEEVFADVAFDFRETPDDTLALRAYTDLMDLYLRVLRETTNWLCEDNRSGAPVGRLLSSAARSSDELTIVTFNHDLIIENEIYRRKSLRKRWCLDHGYGSMSPMFDGLLFPSAGVPAFSLHRDADCDHDRPISILKLHGSLNWMVRLNSDRPTARLLHDGGENRPLQLLTRRRIERRQEYVRSGTGRGRVRWRLWPVVVPPVYAKQGLRSSAIQQAWADARKALRNADRIVLFGYSLPALDIEAEKMFERAVAANERAGWLDVVNPAPSAAARFASVSGKRPIRWYGSLTQLFASDPFSPR